jgi:peptidoglycan/LPS O-acetylase OafA/YrhL
VDKELLSSVKRLNFRKDINFLRALSVVAVIIYHIDKNMLPGGWLGVDVFFFISGYLISNKIVVDLKTNNFKLKNFYIKRIRRIVPALISSLVFTLPFAYFLLPPRELQLFLESFQSSLLFYSNFYFENLDFYNSPSTKYFPLLHTWSLSIEEQYYIVLPLLFLLIYNLKNKYIFKIISLIGLTSLILNLFDFGNSVFYQLPFRMWEFLFGVIFMFLENKLQIKKSSKIIGLLIIFSSFIFFEDSLINEFYTKLLCLIGVFLYLVSTEETKIINLLNRNKIIQQVGLMSFSLYLFHQPIFVFYRIYDTKVDNLNSLYYIILLIFLYIISLLNYKLIEKPFQVKFDKYKKISLGIIFTALCISTITLLEEDSFINRFTNVPQKALLLSFKNQDVISKNRLSCNNRNVENICQFRVSNPEFNIYVLGDSSLRTLSSALLEYQNNNFNLIHFTGDDCLYLIGQKVSNDSCPNNNEKGLDEFVSTIENSIIIYGGRIPRYLSGTGFDNSFVVEENDIEVISDFEKRLENTIINLASKNTLILLYPIPEQGWNIPELYFYNKFEWGETISYPSKIWKERVEKSNILLDKITSKNIIRVYPDRIFCDSFINEQCVGAIGSQIFYSDDDHLSIEGSRLLARIIAKKLEIYK